MTHALFRSHPRPMLYADMTESPLNERLESWIEALVRIDSDECGGLASLLLAARIALRDGYLIDMAMTAWEFIDERRHLPERAAERTSEPDDLRPA